MREKFSSELKAAMKAGEKRRVDTIRMIMAALKDKDSAAPAPSNFRGKPLCWPSS
jgi:uncharacterized protein YqeY